MIKKDFDDGVYDVRENRDTYWHLPWKLIIPPISWNDKFRSINYPKLYEWSFLRQTNIKNDSILNSDNLNAGFILQHFFPHLDIDINYVEAVIDQRTKKIILLKSLYF